MAPGISSAVTERARTEITSPSVATGIYGAIRDHKNLRGSGDHVNLYHSKEQFFCEGYVYVARGSALGAVLTCATIWDLAGGIAILKAAGGVGVTLSGVPLDNAALLEGRVIREPLLFGAPGTVEALRCRIRARR